MVYQSQSQLYYFFNLKHHTENWGLKVWNNFITKDVFNIYLESTVSESLVTPVEFIYPVQQGDYSLEGRAEGHFTVYSLAGSTVTSYLVTLFGLDDIGNYTTFGSHSETLAAPHTIAADDYLVLPIFFLCDKVDVNADQRLVMRFQIGVSSGSVSLSFEILEVNGEYDIQMRIPYAQEEGG